MKYTTQIKPYYTQEGLNNSDNCCHKSQGGNVMQENKCLAKKKTN